MPDFTRADLLAHLDALEPETRALYAAAERLERDAADTLTEDFQLVANVTSVFRQRAIEKWKARREDAPDA